MSGGGPEGRFTIIVDGEEIEASPGQTVLEACDAAGVYIPRLCHHPDLEPAGHCRVCTCKVSGGFASTCNLPVAEGMVVETDSPQLQEDRRRIIEMLVVEGNHFCPACEKSGACELQALAYRLGMEAPRLPHLWPQRELDATHPDVFIDHNRCILCSRCVRASRTLDGKSVFAFEGRGLRLRLTVDSTEGLGGTALEAADRAAQVCPVGAILLKRTGYRVPYGERRFDTAPIGSEVDARRRRGHGKG
jgi:[NiFe] hydrogenase diaphorase moiety small subunit